MYKRQRLGLITGRYQYRLPLGLEEPLAGKTDVGLPPEHPTLPSLPRRAGYGTTLIGKWHLGMLPKFGPAQSGYDHFWGIRTGAIDYYSHKNPRGEDDLWDGDATIQQTGYLTDLLGDRAVESINGYAKQARPFLLSLHFNAPHWPWAVSYTHLDVYKRQDQPQPRRRAHRRVGVGLRQPDSSLRDPIDVRRRTMPAAVARQIGIAEVVGHDEHDIGPVHSATR